MPPEVLVPASLDEAASLFGDGRGLTVFGGGTILMPELASGRLRPERALLLHRAGIDEVVVEPDVVRIGAMVPLGALDDGPDELLARSVRHIGDNELRGSATVGGNLCAPPGGEAQRGELGAALIALGARVRSVGAGGERVEPVEDFVAGERAGRLLLGVEVDRLQRATSWTDLRRRHAHSFAIASVAVASSAEQGLRVGVSGAGRTPVRCRTVEQSGDATDVLADVEPVDDAVAPASYRAKVLPLLVRRALEEVGGGADAGEGRR